MAICVTTCVGTCLAVVVGVDARVGETVADGAGVSIGWITLTVTVLCAATSRES